MKRILVIEDEKPIRKQLELLLEKSGYEVFSAPGGEDGIKLAKAEIPDLILCDVMMPRVDGYQVLGEISKEEGLKDIPFIFLTARVEMSDLRKGMELGADDYLFKPFRAADLLTAVESRLKRFDAIKAEVTSHPKVDEVNDLNVSIELKTNTGLKTVLMKDIICVIGQDEFTRIKLKGHSDYVVRRSVDEWDKLLPDEDYIRIHETSIINSHFIDRVEKWFDNAYMIYMSDVAEPFFISKHFMDRIEKSI